LLFVFDNKDRAVVAEQFDDVEPVVEIGVVLTGINDNSVEGALGEKKLVGRVVDFLSAKVPNISSER